MNADSTIHRYQLEWKSKELSHLFHQAVNLALQRHAQLSTVAVNRCGHQTVHHSDDCDPICHVGNPLRNEKLQLGLSERSLDTAQSAFALFRLLPPEAQCK